MKGIPEATAGQELWRDRGIIDDVRSGEKGLRAAIVGLLDVLEISYQVFEDLSPRYNVISMGC